MLRTEADALAALKYSLGLKEGFICFTVFQEIFHRSCIYAKISIFNLLS